MEQAPLEGDRQDTVFDVPPEHIIQSSSGRGWNGLDIAEIVHPLDDFALPAIPRHVLVINLGFAHESHLALHFKRLTGVTPSYYR